MADIKIRAKEKDGVVTVKALMNHIMESGNRKDKKTGKKIPANNITKVVVNAGGKDVVTADWTGAVSKNPYLACKYAGAKGDTVKVSWEDNQGKTAEAETTVK